MGAFRSGDDQGPMADINITPLVDVMLVLLVIFMVTTPMLESGIAIQLPKASAKALPKSNEPPVTLNIKKDMRVYLNSDEVPFTDLKNHIQSVFRSRSEKEIFIRADGELPYDVVAKAMAIVKSAGINKIGLVTIPPDNQGK